MIANQDVVFFYINFLQYFLVKRSYAIIEGFPAFIEIGHGYPALSQQIQEPKCSGRKTWLNNIVQDQAAPKISGTMFSFFQQIVYC